LRSDEGPETAMPPTPAPADPTIDGNARRKGRGSRPPRGRPPTHGLTTLRKAVTRLGTRRLDGRSAVAVAARRWKGEVAADLGGALSRAQETILEAAAQKLILRDSLSDFLMRLPSLVTRKRQAVAVLRDYLQVSDSLNRDLERLGIERRTADVPSLDAFLAAEDE